MVAEDKMNNGQIVQTEAKHTGGKGMCQTEESIKLSQVILV